MFYQQGDLLLHKEPIPNAIMPLKIPGGILIKSPVTNHEHKIDGPAEFFGDGATRYVRLSCETPLTHQEHKTIMLPAGEYRLGQVREFDHLTDEARTVID